MMRLTEEQLNEFLDATLKRHDSLAPNSNFHLSGWEPAKAKILMKAFVLEFGIVEIVADAGGK